MYGSRKPMQANDNMLPRNEREIKINDISKKIAAILQNKFFEISKELVDIELSPNEALSLVVFSSTIFAAQIIGDAYLGLGRISNIKTALNEDVIELVTCNSFKLYFKSFFKEFNPAKKDIN